MLSRRDAVALIGAGAGLALSPSAVLAQERSGGFDHGAVISRARELAGHPYQAPNGALPPEFDKMSFDAYRNIRFRAERAFFANDKSRFRMDLFHRGFLYRPAVVVNLVREGVAAPIPYDSSLFEFGDIKLGDRLPIDFGFAGIRIRYPINKPTAMDELAVFLGASYFRFLGAGQHYGISARGIAIGTGEQAPEEFPSFREFWVEEPAAGAANIVVHALLDGPSLAGAYRMVVTPGDETTVAVGSTLFPRTDIPKLGVAPLTSMFFYGENDRRQYRGFRPEVHDSDGLLVKTADSEWSWRPLLNPDVLRKTRFPETVSRGFGLLQRDRIFEDYQDLEVRYDLRPSYWVHPEGEWGPGRVELVEIPTDSETFDNIVAFWTPDATPKAGDMLRFSYILRALKLTERLTAKASAIHTFVADANVSGDANGAPQGKRRFIVDFDGGELAYWLDDPKKVVSETSASAGKIEAASVVPNPEIGGFRLFIDHTLDQPGAEATLSAVLKVGGKTLTETWTFLWTRKG